MSDIFERKPLAENKPNLRIESTGSPSTTKLFIGDQVLEGVTSLTMSIDPDKPFIEAQLTILVGAIKGVVFGDNTEVTYLSQPSGDVLKQAAKTLNKYTEPAKQIVPEALAEANRAQRQSLLKLYEGFDFREELKKKLKEDEAFTEHKK